METNNPLSELTQMLKMSADVLSSSVQGLPVDEQVKFNDELIKQGYDKKMGELRDKMAELKNLSKKY